MNKATPILFLLLFTVNPFFFTISAFLLALIVNNRKSIINLIAFISATLYSALIQSQRIWYYGMPSDWNSDVYEGVFLEAGNTGFIEYLFSKKEPVWNFLNYIGYYIYDGSAFYFFNSIAIFTIIILLTSIYLFWKRSGAHSGVLIASLVFIVFFVEFYSNLNNLLRQFFALSIVVYAYVISPSHRRSTFILLILASFIHTVSFIFLFLFMLKPLHERLTLKRIVQVLVIFIFVFIFLNYASILQNIPLLGYAFSRIVTASSYSLDDVIDPSVILINGSIVAFFSLLMYFVNKNISKDLIFFTNMLLIIMLVSIVISTIAPLLMTRLYISRFFFFPFVIPYVLYYSNFGLFKQVRYLYTLSIVLFFVYWFISHFDSIRGGGFFPPFEELLMYSVIDFII